MLMWSIEREGLRYGTWKGNDQAQAFARMVERVFGAVVEHRGGRLRWQVTTHRDAIGDVDLYEFTLLDAPHGTEWLGMAEGCMSCHAHRPRYDCRECRLHLCSVCVVKHEYGCGG